MGRGALGCAPPASAGQGKAPEDRFVFIEHNDLAPARPVLEGGQFERAIGEVCGVGIEATSGTIVAYFLFLRHSAHSHDRVGRRSVGPTPWPVHGNSIGNRESHAGGGLDRRGD